MSSKLVYLALGSNLGKRLTHLRSAVELLRRAADLRLVAWSPVYHSQAHVVDPNDQMDDFLNLVIGIETAISPFDVLEICLSIEKAGGRRRDSMRWRPRTIDIDILTHSGYLLETDQLTLPHPRMAERRFVLMPLNDIAPNLWIPTPFSATVAELLAECSDQTTISRRYRPSAIDAGGSSEV